LLYVLEKRAKQNRKRIVTDLFFFQLCIFTYLGIYRRCNSHKATLNTRFPDVLQ